MTVGVSGGQTPQAVMRESREVGKSAHVAEESNYGIGSDMQFGFGNDISGMAIK